jgi:RHH-type proline utilization regulon transcriptional repressor/proline dehydrogenase/delta 1-pyrroline-5-carboxylate dehydrogenase
MNSNIAIRAERASEDRLNATLGPAAESQSEGQVLSRLRRALALSASHRAAISQDAEELIESVRAAGGQPSSVEQLLAQFSISTNEGLALMGLAEALLRVPDDATALMLVRRQLESADWAQASGVARTFVPKVAARALAVGQRFAGSERSDLNILQRLSAPLVLKLARRAMRYVGDQFILGSTLAAALARARQRSGAGLLSVDLLGEGARTMKNAEQYGASLLAAIQTLKDAASRDAPSSGLQGPAPLQRSSLSIKLSALEPRYEEAQRSRALRCLVPALAKVFEAAANAGLAVTVDAEEQERLELSLDVLEGALSTAALKHWTGAGLAIQAYGTRALDVVEWAAQLARSRGTPLHVRLVKGAYWDTEIKRAQERGLNGYPVFTRKAATDVSYLAAAQRLFSHEGLLWPQFATHNAFTLCAVREMSQGRPYELQRLHGMGERLYRVAGFTFPALAPVRVYAPVGDHRSLLAYLVRRLLENGVNSSFLSQQDDSRISAKTLAADPLTLLDVTEPGVPLPTELFGPERSTARSWDLGREAVWETLRAWHSQSREDPLRITGPGLLGEPHSDLQTVHSPTNLADTIGAYRATSTAEAAQALDTAHRAHRSWSSCSADHRARCLKAAANAFERAAPQLLPLLVREAGKCWPEAIAEFREAVDFCRYYAARAQELARPHPLPGPTGESNVLTYHPRGVFYCIAPWNFPLAIFVGQVVAALAVGNTVLAKPAPQTPLVAAAAVKILIEAGIPADAVQFLPGDGIAVSRAVLGDVRLAGVAFTGSTATARIINRALADRDGPIIPFIAETGGLNVMIVDSTALLEQVVDDVVSSCFRAAGQRCSALRLLCVQEEVAESLLEMLTGAMDALCVGDPADPATDVGPLIDQAALRGIEQYLSALPSSARIVHRVRLDVGAAGGHFCAPTLIQLDTVGDLTREIFGPVLHVVRYRAAELETLVTAIGASGYGLTMGVHTRLPERARAIFADSKVGNTYVNRNTVGAVVGVQPFGGEGLSGTGPKAGGPNYLQRFAVERVLTVNETAWGGNVALLRGLPR